MFQKEYFVYGPRGNRINVQVEYVGPIPRVDEPTKPEVFMYIIRQHDEVVEHGSVGWNPENGPLSEERVADAFALRWNLPKTD